MNPQPRSQRGISEEPIHQILKNRKFIEKINPELYKTELGI